MGVEMSKSPRSLEEPIQALLEKIRLLAIRWRPLILILITIYVSTFEVIEHPNFLTDDKHDFYKEISIYYSLLFLAAIMFEIALRAARIKNQTIKILDARHNLSMQLSAAKDWDDVVRTLMFTPPLSFQLQPPHYLNI